MNTRIKKLAAWMKTVQLGMTEMPAAKASPHKTFIPAPPEKDNCNCNECPYMRLNTLEKLYLCMKNGTPEIIMDEETIAKALKPIELMLEMS